MFEKISDEENRIGKKIVNAAFHVHKELAPGLLEKVYKDGDIILGDFFVP